MCVGKVGEKRRRRENTPNEKDIFKDIKYYIVITIKVDCVRSVRFLIFGLPTRPFLTVRRCKLIVGECVC